MTSKIMTLGADTHGKSTLVKAIGLRQSETGNTLQVLDHFNDVVGWTAGILVVSAPDGPMPDTGNHVKLANHARVPKLVVYLNKIDLVEDTEILDLVELEIRELLSKYKYNGDNAVVVRGSALRASQGDAAAVRSIDALLRALA